MSIASMSRVGKVDTVRSNSYSGVVAVASASTTLGSQFVSNGDYVVSSEASGYKTSSSLLRYDTNKTRSLPSISSYTVVAVCHVEVVYISFCWGGV